VPTVVLFVLCIPPSWKEVKKKYENILIFWIHNSADTILTYSMVQSPSWEANWFAASLEIPRISRKPKVHYRTHKRPPTVPILGQPNPFHIPTSHLLEIRPNIIHPFTPRSPQWSLSLRFPHQDSADTILDGKKSFPKIKIVLTSQNCPVHQSLWSEMWQRLVSSSVYL